MERGGGIGWLREVEGMEDEGKEGRGRERKKRKEKEKNVMMMEEREKTPQFSDSRSRSSHIHNKPSLTQRTLNTTAGRIGIFFSHSFLGEPRLSS